MSPIRAVYAYTTKYCMQNICNNLGSWLKVALVKNTLMNWSAHNFYLTTIATLCNRDSWPWKIYALRIYNCGHVTNLVYNGISDSFRQLFSYSQYCCSNIPHMIRNAPKRAFSSYKLVTRNLYKTEIFLYCNLRGWWS